MELVKRNDVGLVEVRRGGWLAAGQVVRDI
jgi:hypothetical protein